ncbi:MAG: N-acetylmuramoyl-L-alanine amidase [Caldisericaceae bacterium]
MKKLVIFLMIISILFSFIRPASADAQQQLLKCNTDSTNVRKSAGTTSSIVFKLSYGDYVLKLTSVKDGSGNLWFQIYDFNSNRSGFVASWLLDFTGITITGKDTTFTARVNTESLNVRAGPGREFKLVSTLPQGNKISVTRIVTRSDKEEWYKFKASNGQYYFVAGWYTEKFSQATPTPSNPEPSPASNTTTQTAATSDYLNLREGPSTDYSKIALIDKGDAVQIVGAAKNANGELWAQVVYKSFTGWAIADYLTYKNTLNIDTTVIGGTAIANDVINVRELPTTLSAVLSTLAKGFSVDIVGVAMNKDKEIWYEVRQNSKFGWVLSSLFSVKKKDKGTIKSITWSIASTGIDINISGQSIPSPQVSLLENPTRLTLNFSLTSLVSQSGSTELNIYPIIRVRYDLADEGTLVTVDLIREIPYEVEYKSNSLIIVHLTLPKVGQKLVEVSGREIYANVNSKDGESYIDIDDFARSFDISIDKTNLSFSFFGKNITLDKSSIVQDGSSMFVAVSYICKLLNISLTETEHEIYLDPTLLDYSKSSNSINLKFSFSTDAKKITENGKSNVAFYADAGTFSLDNSRKRDGNNPPEIVFEVTPAATIVAKENTVQISLADVPKAGKLSQKTIVIDPGHGSYTGPYLDVGAVGPSGVKEAYVVLDIALRLQKLLEAEGANVILTHTTVDSQSNPTLSERAAIANSSGGDLFISIHLNASIDAKGNGTETYYWYDTSKKFAQSIQSSLVQALGTSDRGVKKDDLYVCKNVTTMPSILAEIVFVSNPTEESKCKNSNFLDTVAQALKQGIENYLIG